MDFFGIGAALSGSARIYFQAARRTGRTASLVESVKDGDRVVFTNEQEARRVKSLIRDRGVEVDCIVISPRESCRIFERGTPEGRTIFDHTWIEEFYLGCLQQAQDNIAHLERETSGYGEPHRETRRASLEITKFQ